MGATGSLVRVFLSSTFDDFTLDRNLLQESVWPRVRAYCQSRGARFQIIDLRWGISEEASQDQRSIAICLEEVRRCQQVSPAFSFLALVGDRHGSRLLPESIPAPDFERLLAVLGPQDQGQLRSWYRLDHNALPRGEYVLLPRGGPGAVAGGKYAPFNAWEVVQRQLLDTLTWACHTADITEGTRFAILASVTEREIAAGVLDADDGGAGALVFRRHIERAAGAPVSPRYIEHSPLGRERLAALEQALSARLPDSSISTYTAHLQGDGLTTEHLHSFGEQVYQAVLTRIEQTLEAITAEERTTRTYQQFAVERLRAFAGREDALATIATYLNQPARTPLLISGVGGVGKTTLLLRALEQAESSSLPLQSQAVIVQRFIGGSSAVADLAALLRDIAATVHVAYHAGSQEIPTDREELIAQLPTYLGRATAERPLIVVLDGVDQLRDGGADLFWLPDTLPPHTHLIVSTRSTPGVRSWLTTHPHVPVVELHPLGPHTISAVLADLLADGGRTLQPEQERRLVERCAVTGLPLYMRLAADVARSWRSWQGGPDLPDLPSNVSGLLQARFEQLESPTAHGQDLVVHALGLLGAAKLGLAEDELLDVLGQDPATRQRIISRSPHSPQVAHVPVVLWSRLSFDLDALLAEREANGLPLIAFYHREVGEAVQARYLQGASERARHEDLAQYYEGQPVQFGQAAVNTRKLDEQVFQEAQAGLEHNLRQTLTDGAYLATQIRTNGVIAALTDVVWGERDTTIRRIGQVLSSVGEILEENPEEVWNQIQGCVGLGATLHTSLPRRVPRLDLISASLPFDQALVRVYTPGRSNAFSPDGTRVLSARVQDTLRLWDVASGATVRVFAGHRGSLYDCAFSPDGTQALSASADRTLRLWDVASGATVRVFAGHTSGVTACAFSPDGRYVLSASGDQTLRLWDVASGATVQTFSGHRSVVNDCAFSPDGTQILSASGAVGGGPEDTLRLWDVASGTTVRTFRHPITPTTNVTSCAFSPDGAQVLSATSMTDRTLRLWDVASGMLVRAFEGHRLGIVDCAFSPDGTQALSASADRTLRLWDVASGATVRTFIVPSSPAESCAFSPNGAQIISGWLDDRVRVWETSSTQSDRVQEGLNDEVLGCAVSRDGTLALSTAGDGSLRLWDMATQTTMRVFRGHSGRVFDCAFSPDGSYALSAAWNSATNADDEALRLWDVNTGELVRSFIGHTDEVHACVFSPDGKLALSASDDHTLRLWDVTSGMTVRTFLGHGSGVRDCAFSPDGTQAISVSLDSTMRLWDVATGTPILTFEGGVNRVSKCAFSPDGRWVLSDAGNPGLCLWDRASGHVVRHFPVVERFPRDYTFSPDGRLILCAHTNVAYNKGWLQVVDIESGLLVVRWVTDTLLDSCTAHPDGRTIIAGGAGNLHFLSLVR